MYAHRLAGNFTSLNPAGERITGWSRAQLVGMKMNDLVAPEQREQLQKAIAAIVESGQIGSLEFEIVTPQGERKSLEATARAIQRGGEAVAIEGIARDVTERKRAEEELKSSREQLRLLAARLRSIREEERTRIAREVHDELGQSLTGLKMDISSIASRLPTGEKILLERARAMSELIDESIRKVRQIATDLRPGILDNLGLVAALEWHAEDFQTRTGIECNFTAKLEDEGLNPELCTALFRIFQETLTNVTRHAQATAVIVTLEEWEGGLLLEVRDNGRGINERQIHWRESLGLLGMRERALACGGEVTITGTRGLGTTVTTRMPLARISEMRA